MKTAFATLTAGLAALTLTVPAYADDRRGHDRHYSKHDRRDNARAYQQGYRDGMRADDRRGPASARPYYNNSRWNQGYRVDNRYPAYANGYPVNTSQSRANSRYWWGDNGRIQCRREDGTTGLIVGALAGGTLGNVLAREGDKRLGSVIGGTLGAVLGNEISKGNVRCR